MDSRLLRAVAALLAAALAGLSLLIAADDRAIGDGVSLDPPRITAAERDATAALRGRRAARPTAPGSRPRSPRRGPRRSG